MVAPITISPGAVGDPARDECFRNMQVALAGMPIGSVLAAQIDSLAITVVVASADRAKADELLAALTGDLRAALDRNWDLVKAQLVETQEPGHA